MDVSLRAINVLRENERVTLKLRELYELYGYKKFTMVKFEEYDFYAQNMDYLQNNRLMTFTESTGKLMALRPDVTMSIIKRTKAGAENCEKLYYTENVYRTRSMSAEFEESSQIGIEHIGAVDQYTNIELTSLALKSLGIIEDENILDISHMGFLSGMLSKSGATASLKAKILRCIEEKNAHELRLIASGTLSQELTDKLVAIMHLPSSFEEAVSFIYTLCVNDQMKSAYDELRDLCIAMDQSGLLDRIRLDFSIASDTEYYNGIMFRGYVQGVSKAVLSGGRYDLLLSKMGKPGLQAIGFAIYFDELERYLNASIDNSVDAVIIYNEGSDMMMLISTIDRLTQSGKRVWAGKHPPDGMHWNELYSIENSSLKKEEQNA